MPDSVFLDEEKVINVGKEPKEPDHNHNSGCLLPEGKQRCLPATRGESPRVAVQAAGLCGRGSPSAGDREEWPPCTIPAHLPALFIHCHWLAGSNLF